MLYIVMFRLLRAQAAYYTFRGAAETHKIAMDTIQQLKSAGYTSDNYAALYGEFSVLFFNRSEYDEAYKQVFFIIPFCENIRFCINSCFYDKFRYIMLI